MKLPAWAVLLLCFFGFGILIVALLRKDVFLTLAGGYILIRYIVYLMTHTLQGEVSRRISQRRKEHGE